MENLNQLPLSVIEIKDKHNKKQINKNVIANYSKLKSWVFIPPLLFTIPILFFLFQKDAFCINQYIHIQQDWFFAINSRLSKFSYITYNLTQFGDALIFLSLISILIIYAPKIWEALLISLLFSSIFSCTLKKIFAVPRPPAVFDNDSFTIIGKKLCSNSFPSGHSITVFTILTILLFAFLPKKVEQKVLYFLGFIAIGLILAFTRVGVGAHYPLDVVFGSIIGYISGLLGIFISRKYKILTWIGKKKYYPVLLLLFITCSTVLINKIVKENLIIFYFSLATLVVTTYKIAHIYAKE